jgi:hypothetical protein
VTKKAQSKFGLKPTLPDFYNILMERHRLDPDGYGILFVDASRHANMGSSCSHSCESNCTSSIVVRNGKTSIVMTTVSGCAVVRFMNILALKLCFLEPLCRLW